MTLRRITILAVLLAVSLMWFTCSNGEPDYPITNAQPTGTNIIAFGDSLTIGYGAQSDDAYPAVLSKRLGVPIINAGITGDTSEGALQRLERDVLGRDPRIVLICLGGNDVFRKIPAEQTMDNLRKMIGRIQDRGAMVILIGLTFPMHSHGRLYPELAKEMGCPFVPDLLDGILARTELMADSVHPNAAGYQRVADKIEPVLRSYILPSQE